MRTGRGHPKGACAVAWRRWRSAISMAMAELISDSGELISGLSGDDGPPLCNRGCGGYIRDNMVTRITATTIRIDTAIRALK